MVKTIVTHSCQRKQLNGPESFQSMVGEGDSGTEVWMRHRASMIKTASGYVTNSAVLAGSLRYIVGQISFGKSVLREN